MEKSTYYQRENRQPSLSSQNSFDDGYNSKELNSENYNSPSTSRFRRKESYSSERENRFLTGLKNPSSNREHSNSSFIPKGKKTTYPNNDDSYQSEYIDPNRENELRTELQRKFYYFFEEPKTFWAKAFSAFSLFLSLLVILIICVESLPSTWPWTTRENYLRIWLPLDAITIITFSVDYGGRLYASINRVYYNELSLTLRIFRALRFLRILRLFRISKHALGYNVNYAIAYRVFRRSAYQLFVVLIYVLLIILSSSALLWIIERGTFDLSDNTYYRINEQGQREKSPFQSIIHSFWWSIVTLTTTGYGDYIPASPIGKVIAALTMTCGIMVIALPTSIIGSNFMAEWQERRRIRFQRRFRNTQEQYGTIYDNYQLSKSKRLKQFKENNQILHKTINDIQEHLADINPPRYYKRYKELQLKYIKALEKIKEFEDKEAKYKRFNKNLEPKTTSNIELDKQFNDSTKNFGKKIKDIPRKIRNSTIRKLKIGSSRDPIDKNMIKISLPKEIFKNYNLISDSTYDISNNNSIMRRRRSSLPSISFGSLPITNHTKPEDNLKNIKEKNESLTGESENNNNGWNSVGGSNSSNKNYRNYSEKEENNEYKSLEQEILNLEQIKDRIIQRRCREKASFEVKMDSILKTIMMIESRIEELEQQISRERIRLNILGNGGDQYLSNLTNIAVIAK
ncbi:5768_t:CDS:2 [Diversispora eburnea]|uniref:5768_t:CDS:1 n=1 Tax=Diversispora eburnea TaxID=1213867 RepID=A0A9N8ZIG7_9GLOM|nr:5768_t:CDS:2 [Diversispora eburnea]